MTDNQSSEDEEIRTLDITDEERVKRFKHAGYGGNVSSALSSVGVRDTVLSNEFTPLYSGMELAGRVIPVKLHSQVRNELTEEYIEEKRDQQFDGKHPQRVMMETVEEREAGSILCFDCGGDMQPAHFGEMSCHLARMQGCRGMLIAGNIRDVQYVREMGDFPVFNFGTTPNAYGGWSIQEVGNPIYLPGHLTHYVEINPGDFVYADADGAQVIPERYVDEVLLRVEETHEEEMEERERIEEGMSVDEVYEEFGVL